MWLYNDKELTDEDIKGHYGFIYQIDNLIDGRSYIGRKYFTKAGTKQVKGKKRKTRKESDWKDYYGSSPRLLEDIEKLGRDNFKRSIIRLCKTRGETNYWEAKLIFQHDAIISEKFYNDWISCKIRSTHLKFTVI